MCGGALGFFRHRQTFNVTGDNPTRAAATAVVSISSVSVAVVRFLLPLGAILPRYGVGYRPLQMPQRKIFWLLAPRLTVAHEGLPEQIDLDPHGLNRSGRIGCRVVGWPVGVIRAGLYGIERG